MTPVRVRKRRRPNRYGPHHTMVEMYHLQRDTEIRAKEVAGGDEYAHVTTFKEWLQSYRWETEPAKFGQSASHTGAAVCVAGRPT